MILGAPLPDVLMGSIAERRIGGELAVAQLEVARLRHIERHGAASRHNPLALTVAHGVVLTVTAGAPTVFLATAQEHVGGENTSVSGHGRRSVATLLVGARLTELDAILKWEVGHVVHGLDLASALRGFQNHGVSQHDVAFVGLEFATSWARKGEVVRDRRGTYSTLT